MDVWKADPARDASRIATLRYAWAATSGRNPGPFEDDFTECLRQWWVEEGRTIFVSGDHTPAGGGISGMVSLHEYRRMPMPGEGRSAWGYVGHLFVLPAARSQGHGHALIERVQAEARERGYCRLVLSPTEESVDLYRRSGFRAADELMVWTPDAGTTS